VHIKENARNFHRFEAVWTPTVLVLAADGKERGRLEGYLPKNEFRAFLEMGLARVDFMQKKWSNSKFAAEAIYYRGVSRYSQSHDSGDLAATAQVLADKYTGSEWQLRSLPWAKE
jgi:thioredoxin-related protein